jgi:hypothetical protein
MPSCLGASSEADRAGPLIRGRSQLVGALKVLMTRDVRGAAEYQALVNHLTAGSQRVHAIAARNIKRVGDVDKSRPGTFLFTISSAKARSGLGALGLPGRVVPGRDGSGPPHGASPLGGRGLQFHHHQPRPVGCSLVSVLARQLAKKSFRSYVLGDVNQVGACPSSIALPDLDRDRVGRYAEVLDQLTDPPSNRAPRHRPPKWSYPYGAEFGLVPRHEAPPLNSGASGREG